MMELPEVDELKVARFILEGRDPFAFGRKPHKRIKGLKIGKRKRRKVRIVSLLKRGRNGRAKVTKVS